MIHVMYNRPIDLWISSERNDAEKKIMTSRCTYKCRDLHGHSMGYTHSAVLTSAPIALLIHDKQFAESGSWRRGRYNTMLLSQARYR